MPYVLVLLGLICTAGTWWFGLRAFFTVPFEGPTTAAEEHAAAVFLVVALGCGFVVPVIGVLISMRTRRWFAAGFFALVLVAVCVVAVRTGVLTRSTIGGLYREFVPAKPTPTHTHCREYSGGGNECPGG